MNTSEKFCLKWNDFQKNISSTFGSLREDNDFADVTLASEDGQQVEAHKIILAYSSPFFQNLLMRNKHAHPLTSLMGNTLLHMRNKIWFKKKIGMSMNVNMCK